MKRLQSIASEARLASIIGTLLSRGLSTVLSFGLILVLARALSPEEYGRYAFVFSVATALGIILTLGQTTSLIKHFREDSGLEDSVNASLVSQNVRWMGIAALLAAGIGFLAWIFQVEILGLTPAKWALAAFFAVVFQASEYLQSWFRARGRYTMALVPRENVWRILAILSLLAVVISGYELDSVSALLLVTLALLIAISPQMLSFGREFASRLGREKRTETLDTRPGENRSFGFNMLMNAVSGHIETIMVGLVIGFSELAVFFIVLRITMLLYLPITSIETVALPMIANALRIGDKARTQRLMAMFGGLTFGLALLGGIVLFFIYPFVLNLFNPEFSAPATVVLLMIATAWVQSFIGVNTGYLMVSGGESFFLAFRTVLLVHYCAGLALFGALFGIVGVAGMMLVFMVAESGLTWWWCRKHLGLDISAFSALGLLRKNASDPA
jgi:O-antigen/teichoic acid export membrane protein